MRCGRVVRCELGLDDLVCTGCLTLREDVADTAAFVAACDRAARAATNPAVALRAQQWMERALENLVRRHRFGFDGPPVTIGDGAER